MPTRYAQLKDAPVALGLNGELEALWRVVCAYPLPVPEGEPPAPPDLATLMGVSGLAFRFFVPNPDSPAFSSAEHDLATLPNRRAQRLSPLDVYDGPDPLRLAARYAGWSYTAHRVNSLSGMSSKVQRSIDAGIPVITRNPKNPAQVAVVVAYTTVQSDPGHRQFHLRLHGVPEPVALDLPKDPEEAILEVGPMRNFIGLLESGVPIGEEEQQGMRRQALVRAQAAVGGASMTDRWVETVSDWLGGREAYVLLADQIQGGSIKAMSLSVSDLHRLLTDLLQARGFALTFARQEMADRDGHLPPSIAETLATLEGARDRLQAQVARSFQGSSLAETDALADAITRLSEAECQAFQSIREAL